MFSKSFLLFLLIDVSIPAIGIYILILISSRLHKYVRREKKNFLLAPVISSIYILLFGVLYIYSIPSLWAKLSYHEMAFIAFLFGPSPRVFSLY